MLVYGEIESIIMIMEKCKIIILFIVSSYIIPIGKIFSYKDCNRLHISAGCIYQQVAYISRLHISAGCIYISRSGCIYQQVAYISRLHISAGCIYQQVAYISRLHIVNTSCENPSD